MRQTASGVGAICIGRDGEASAICKFAGDRLRHGNFRVIVLGLVLEEGDSNGMDRVRQVRGGS